MKEPSILFCRFGALDPVFGGGKVYCELCRGLQVRGWRAEIVDLRKLADGLSPNPSQPARTHMLRAYIRSRQNEFDVIEYDIGDLPFSRKDFGPDCLLAARSVLLELHRKNPFPMRLNFPGRMKALLKAPFRKATLQRHCKATVKTAREADIVHVPCPEDAEILEAANVPRSKILQLPYGLTPEEFEQLAVIADAQRLSDRVLFLGTFDWRKGAADIPAIFDTVARQVPDVQFRLAGTAGVFQTEAAVRRQFPEHLQTKLEVIARYPRDRYLDMVRDCTAGVFPSRLEGCPFAVLEQMAAGIPVAAYRAPGASMLLPSDQLSQPGDTRFLSDRLTEWLREPDRRAKASERQRALVSQYSWDAVIDRLDEYYRKKLSSA